MSKKEFLKLSDKYLAGKTSREEEQFLFDIYQRVEDKYEWSQAEMDTLDQLEFRLIQRFKKSIKQSAETGRSGAVRQPESTRQLEATHQSEGIYQPEGLKVKRGYFNRNLIRLTAAASLLFVSIGVVYWMYNNPSSAVTKVFADNKVKDLVTHSNNTQATEKLIFPDKSYVELTAGSKVIYERDFSGSLRQIYLSGEGFFQVTRDQAKPFIVYTDKVVAKVLGTSFIVKSGLNNTVAGVQVKTGKVSVFRTKEFTKENTNPGPAEGVILLPNHAVDLNPKEELEKKLALSPEILKPQPEEKFDFNDTPIDTVFSRLQDAYGISIVYDKVKFSSCSLSVKMGKEGFYQKLDLICRTINVSYQVRDGNVLVSGSGCAQ